MDLLSRTDHRKIAALARDMYSSGSVKAISERLVQGLDDLIGGTSVLVGGNQAKTKALQIMAENGGSEFRRLLHEATTFSHEHPGIRYHYVHRGRAVTVSDLLPLRQWKKTRLYNEFFVELGMQEQLGGSFPSAFPDLMGAIVSRTRRTFTRRDRLLLDVVRFHASEAFQTAQWKAPNGSAALAVDALEPVAGASVVVLDSTGELQFCSERAQGWLQSFFAEERPFQGGLPLTIHRWVRQELAAFQSDALSVRPPQPLAIRHGEKRLCLRLSNARGGLACLVFLRVEDPVGELAKLRALGLGPRATEVLYWVMQGKTNEEIAIILQVSPRTVEKHLEHILVQLGVENRTAAALAAAAVSSRSGRPDDLRDGHIIEASRAQSPLVTASLGPHST
jgi:DNA-binding CsgD family transcriptional regulator